MNAGTPKIDILSSATGKIPHGGAYTLPFFIFSKIISISLLSFLKRKAGAVAPAARRAYSGIGIIMVRVSQIARMTAAGMEKLRSSLLSLFKASSFSFS